MMLGECWARGPELRRDFAFDLIGERTDMATTATQEKTDETATETKAPELSPEEIADRLRPSDPRISPDGKAVAFVVAPLGKKEEQVKQAIWWSRDGQPAKQFSGGEHSDHSPRWSPDGTKLAFISNRKDKEGKASNLFVSPVDGGEALALGDLKGSLSHPQWSPDGKSIAVLRTDEDTEAEKKAKEEEKKDHEVFEEDDKLTRLWVIDAASGKARCLTHGNRHILDYAWAPDSERLVLVTGDEPNINAWLIKTHLSVVAASGGLQKPVADFPSGVGAPVIREVDGQEVVALIADDHRNDPSQSVWTVPLTGGEKRNLLPGYEGVVAALEPLGIAPDALGLLMIEGTQGKIYRLSANGGELGPITPPSLAKSGTFNGISFSADGSRIAGIWTDSSHPEEVFIGKSDGNVTTVSEFGKPFADRLQAGEVVRWQSSDGVEIEGVLIKPRDCQEGMRYPLVVQVHGGPSWQWEDRANLSWHDWAQMLASRGYAVLLPNPRGSTGRGSAFEKLLQDDVGGGEAQDLISGARAMVERGIADPDRLGIAGWSWGGYLTAWTITQTDIFKAAVMGAGLANLISDHGAGDIPNANLMYYPGHPYEHFDHYADRSPLKHVTKVKTPTLILHGANDVRVHPEQGQEYYRALKVLGVPTRLVRYPREGHGIAERNHQIDIMERIIDWLGKYLR
jgi:dipeptidyl aminopeptidase/acylaminoacyl peptidase